MRAQLLYHVTATLRHAKPNSPPDDFHLPLWIARDQHCAEFYLPIHLENPCILQKFNLQPRHTRHFLFSIRDKHHVSMLDSPIMSRFHETWMGVYFDDLDAFQILHNARYLLLFERTIGSFWKHLGWGGVLDAQKNPDQFHLVRANSVEYLRPVVGVCDVRVRVWVEKLGRTSLTFGFRVLPTDEDTDYARGTRTIVRVDPATHRPVPWTDAFRETLTPYRADLGNSP